MTARKSLHWKAFLLALGISTAVFLPFVIYNGGYFILSEILMPSKSLL